MRLSTLFFLLLLAMLCYFVIVTGRTHAATPLPDVAGCPRYTTDDVVAWIVCSNTQQERRLAALEARPAAGLSRDDVWQLSGDRVYYDLKRLGLVK